MKNFLKKHWFLSAAFGVFLAFCVYFLIILSCLPFGVSQYFKMFGGPFTHKQFLVVLQNDAELRPTGGFVTSYTVLDFDHGVPTGFEINDVYFGIDQHKYVAPPYPLEELLGFEFYKGHSFRDANFYPDFPQSSAELLKFYKMTNPDADFDGVFAVNYSMLEDALSVLGNVRVGDMLLNENNVFESLEHYVSNIDRHNLQQIKDRKGVLKDLAKKVISRAIFSPHKYAALAGLVAREFETKNVMMWFDNFENEYDGAYPKDWDYDFLAFNEGNYGGMKTSRYIKRDVRYFLTIERDNVDGGYKLLGDTRIELSHIGSENIPLSGPYSGYFRLYLPADTRLLSDREGLYFEDDDEYFVLGQTLELEPGEVKTLNYKYELPPSIFDRGIYKLNLEKQSGTNDHYAVYVQAPSGVSISSDNFVTKENTASFSGRLDRDLVLEMEVLPDEFPPRLVYQDFLDPSTIVLHFNEDLPSSCAVDSLNYEVNDLNMNRPEIDQTISIESVTHSGSGVFIHLKEPIDQEDEHFAIELKNIFDVSGNFIEPNPKLITVVQNFIK